MIVILTHRQMDFDALASMVAAQKIFPDSFMVVDGKSNPYVQDFIALAKDRLPFLRPKDVDWTNVEKIVLVDTHNLQRAAGVKEEVFDQIPLVVYDHHPYYGSLTEQMHIESIGSCTTLLIEEIRKMAIQLSPFEATLLALGIYDDTGSLLFESTTVRDVKAVAYLLEQGANLGVVAEYLRKPLIEDQKELLQQLLDNGKTKDFRGQPVYISWAEGDEYVGGLALLAHRVGEMEGAETLFLVVKMENRVYLVGRSRGRGLEVNRIVQTFGGAGHARAASATVKNASVNEILKQLNDELEQQAHRINRVKDIMSYPVKTVSPEMKLSEVEQILLKYGHTGVPVAQENQLVGIISRRDVDKAIKHGLAHAPVKGFMTKDVVVVDADSSWEDVQRTMVQHDIGRVPVLEDGKLAGIVSRSDILRIVHGSAVPTEMSLTRHRSLAMREDILHLFEELPKRIRSLLGSAQQVADELGYSVFVVGGFVRDILLKVPTQDLDFVIEGDGHAFARALADQLQDVQVVFHDQFGTARLDFSDGSHLDVASSRREDYSSPGALPQVEESRLRDDMFRRDFTINAMAIAINSIHYGELVDYYGGLRDLKQGEIRFLHNLSFIEDPTRILRALRFAGRYGFRLAKETSEGLYTALDAGVLQKLSIERFTEEFMHMLSELKFGVMGESMLLMGVLRKWFGAELPWDFTHPKLNEEISPERKLLISLRRMDKFQFEKVQEKLRLPREIKGIANKYFDVMAGLISLGMTEKASLRNLDQYLEGIPAILLEVFLWDERFCDSVETYVEAVKGIHQTTDGMTLRQWGIKEGPEIGRILKAVRLAWLEGKIHTGEEEKEFVLSFLKGGLSNRPKGETTCST
ncbi:MAG TPA: CBS domain-containing protein [Desulfitobacterium dehalogenans]|uniref:CBS domain-containing protein n=1 Tax=Desulfitobacterium dehalogenans TaxID=36854 RepID=A0A7C7D7S0_9FIRM|nr:CBS domain-containing protein [Desulfitobacterium dehalogenans]